MDVNVDFVRPNPTPLANSEFLLIHCCTGIALASLASLVASPPEERRDWTAKYVAQIALSVSLVNLLITRIFLSRNGLRSPSNDQLADQLNRRTVIPQFCKRTAEFVNAFVPRLLAEKMEIVPSFTETTLLYYAGIPFRYLYRQLEKQWQTRNRFIASDNAKCLLKTFNALTFRAIENLFSPSPVDFERALLQACLKARPLLSGQNTPQLRAVVVKTLATSLSQQREIDSFLKGFSFNSREEAYIARLAFHETHHSLPQGIPKTLRLTRDNLREMSDRAYSNRLKPLVEKVLEKCCPESLETGLLRIGYSLEGKDLLIDAITFLVVEYGVKQLADPHLLALALLYSMGIETAGFELDGFGRMMKPTLLETGQKMLLESLKEETSPWSVASIFNQSPLKHSPGGHERTLQEQEAKNELQKSISKLLYDAIKEKEYRSQQGALKAIREQVSQLPVVGSATIGLHIIVSGALFSLSYPLRSTEKAETSLGEHLFRNLAGTSLCNRLAEDIVALIYHPTWPITLMQLVDAIVDHFEHDLPLDPPHVKESFVEIVKFLSSHFEKSISLAGLVGYFASDTIAEKLEGCLNNSNGNIFEKSLEALLPTMRELSLYNKVIIAFRKEGVSFEGDAKFWEIFIRETLNERTNHEIIEGGHERTLEIVTTIRDGIVTTWLNMETKTLRETLGHLPAPPPPIVNFAHL